ncbi:hypothetical protein [Ectobacillus panaciterrae]|uniref:hypothetical protein n=1 Tax=Ectobacillus panaciterrae TaxID=363872 RepID=UPI0004284A7C
MYIQKTFQLGELIFLTMITLVGCLSAVIMNIPLVIGFAPGFLLLLILVWRKGIAPSVYLQLLRDGFYRTKEVSWLLLLISILLPTWVLSGTIDHIVKLILQFVHIPSFLVFVFISTSLLSMLLGTALGTLSILGLPMMQIAEVVHLSPAWVAGALISGVFVGDQNSPFSSSRRLLKSTLQMEEDESLPLFTPIWISGIIVSVCFYTFGDVLSPAHKTSYSSVHYDLNWFLSGWYYYLPPAFLVGWMCVTRNLRNSFLSSIFIASILIITNHIQFSTWIISMWNGIQGMGGLKSGILLFLFIGIAGIYCEMLDKCQILKPFLTPFIKAEGTEGAALRRSFIFALLITFLSPNQTFPILLTGRSLIGHWKRYVSITKLSQVLQNTTMLLVGLIPWNLIAILCSQILRVSVFAYAPYACFLWAIPAIMWFYTYFLIKNNK